MAAKPIMIIEDDEGLSRLISDILSDDGHNVTVFNDPYRAVAEFGHERFSLVITDVKMPKMDGIEVLDHVKRIDPNVPVIIITAHATVDVSIQALRKGAEDLITKPFEAEEFLYRIRKVLRKKLKLALTTPQARQIRSSILLTSFKLSRYSSMARKRNTGIRLMMTFIPMVELI